jgi:hypothetical protein
VHRRQHSRRDARQHQRSPCHSSRTRERRQNEEDTVTARKISALRAQRDVALQRGFDIARENAVSFDHWDNDAEIEWGDAEKALAEEKAK